MLFPETYAYWREVEERYGTRIEVFEGPSLGRQAAEHGANLWETAPDRCCGIRKVEPLGRALAGRDAWITGVRRDQSPTRANTPKLTWDAAHGLWKANPLADWDDARGWEFIRARELPYNALHDRGYASIGCTYCTMPGSGREGRWSASDKTECGLHDLNVARTVAIDGGRAGSTTPSVVVGEPLSLGTRRGVGQLGGLGQLEAQSGLFHLDELLRRTLRRRPELVTRAENAEAAAVWEQDQVAHSPNIQ